MACSIAAALAEKKTRIRTTYLPQEQISAKFTYFYAVDAGLLGWAGQLSDKYNENHYQQSKD
ncbi:hypothetical protein SR858_17580 [Duganella zoogloeoides]|uniref:Uncharacterized protein n=1 Tax=Duganella zoogloeoides TaxID=75659 RepID=A0ABZ0XTX9_9BURK|nr:hypothetical protein [Duganella zoogloeoides]WQH02869.1 hypothetical protein SR858_17580 [Duganella zoogloeoides]